MWLEQLKSGKWRGGYRDATGRKRQRTFLHKTAAREWARDGEEAVERGLDPDAGKVTLGEWAKRWQAARVVSDVTEYNSGSRVEVIVGAFGEVPLERMSTLDIQAWEKRLGRNVGPGTVRLYHGTLSAVLEAAVRERLIPVNPAKFVQKPRPPRAREVYLTPAEVEATAAHMPEPYATVCLVKPWLGFRWGEMAGLRVADLDMLRRTAQVRQVVTEIGSVRDVRPYPKTASSFRTVPIPPATAEVLAAYLAATPRPRDGLVFVHADGRPLSRNRMSRLFKKALEDAKVSKDARPHDLRHSGASWLAQAGVPIFDISKWLGHETIAMTQRYAHAVQGQHDAVAAALAALSRGTERGTEVAHP